MPEPRASSLLKSIELSKIRPNKINPRGPNVRENDPHRENLKESIAEFGILVPFVVRRIDGEEYELVDGERRYWIAKSLKFKEVPAILIDGGLDSNAVLQRMFQIHMNRDQWDAVQQCKASEPFYAELLARHQSDQEALIDDFANFTGTDRRTARNRVQFLRWPKNIKEEIYKDPEKHDSYWYVVEIEDKIVEPARKNYPEYFQRVDANDVRIFLYRKWEANVVKAAVDVRQAAVIVRSPIKDKTQRRKLLKIFDKLVKDTDLSYEEAFKEFAQQFPNLVERKLPKPRALLNSVRSLADVFLEYEPEFFTAFGRKKATALDEIVEAVRGLITAAQAFLKRIRP